MIPIFSHLLTQTKFPSPCSHNFDCCFLFMERKAQTIKKQFERRAWPICSNTGVSHFQPRFFRTQLRDKALAEQMLIQPALRWWLNEVGPKCLRCRKTAAERIILCCWSSFCYYINSHHPSSSPLIRCSCANMTTPWALEPWPNGGKFCPSWKGSWWNFCCCVAQNVLKSVWKTWNEHAAESSTMQKAWSREIGIAISDLKDLVWCLVFDILSHYRYFLVLYRCPWTKNHMTSTTWTAECPYKQSRSSSPVPPLLENESAYSAIVPVQCAG